MYLDRKYSYRRTLPHILKDNRPVFVTFGTFKRWELPAEARQLVFECCLRECGATIDLHAAVVMPTHAHLLFTPLRNEEGWLGGGESQTQRGRWGDGPPPRPGGANPRHHTTATTQPPQSSRPKNSSTFF